MTATDGSFGYRGFDEAGDSRPAPTTPERAEPPRKGYVPRTLIAGGGRGHLIRGMHGLFYSSKAKAMREFMRDKLKLPYSDIGDGWLIFDLPEADIGVHPTDASGQPPSGTHDVSFYCDDIQGTVAELTARGVRFDQAVEDHGYGFVTYFTMPGGVSVQLYEPKYGKRISKSRTAAPPARTESKAKTSKIAVKGRRH